MIYYTSKYLNNFGEFQSLALFGLKKNKNFGPKSSIFTNINNCLNCTMFKSEIKYISCFCINSSEEYNFRPLTSKTKN